MSVQKFLDKIKNGRYGADITDAIIGGIKKCYDDASVNHDNANMEVKMARGTHNTLNDRLDKSEQKLDETNAQLSETKQELSSQLVQARPYEYTNNGIAFKGNNTHNAWTHGTVAYDKNTNQTIVFYSSQPEHLLTNQKVYMVKKNKNGNFETPLLVADKSSEGLSCRCQGAGICANGDYVAIVGYINNSTTERTSTKIYRSVDRGSTWTISDFLVNGEMPIGFDGHLDDFYVMKSGRILTGCTNLSKNCRVFYSDDNANTWNPTTINGSPTTYFEYEFCELSSGTVICIMRKTYSSNYTVEIPAMFMKSTDGGVTWSKPIEMSLTMTENNGALIHHDELNAVEFIYGSRFIENDGYSSIFVATATDDMAENGNFNKPIRIGRFAPKTKQADGYTGDGGYFGAVKTEYDTIDVFYYNGTNKNANICYMEGKKAKDSNGSLIIDDVTGMKELNTSDDYYLYGKEFTFKTGGWEKGLEVGQGKTLNKNVDNIEIVLNKTLTSSETRLCIRNASGIDVTDLRYLEVELFIDNVTTTFTSGVGVYTIKSPTSAIDGRNSYTSVSESGYHKLIVDVRPLTGVVYPMLTSVIPIANTGTVTTKFYSVKGIK